MFTLQQIFEKSWQYAKDVYTCLVEFKKPYDRQKFWGVLREYSVDGPLLLAVGSVLSRFDRFLLIKLRAPSTHQGKLTLSIEAACV